MPFNQLILFPTEMKLKKTRHGVRLLATPIPEIEGLHGKKYVWSSLSAAAANRKLRKIPSGPLHVKLQIELAAHDDLLLRYQGHPLATIRYEDLENGKGSVELLLDTCVSEIFVDEGMRYITKEVPPSSDPQVLECVTHQDGSVLHRIEVYRMKSMWRS